MKGQLIAIFITVLIISGLISNGIVVHWELGKIEETFSQIVYAMYFLPVAVSAVITNIYYKVWSRNTSEDSNENE